ncbi:MAG: hypothetical protein CUN55_08085 [Phototrophicales bacterium]|nr:MAG: hypothetical protein CUN55_08085 [Phototrophicales bacterium]
MTPATTFVPALLRDPSLARRLLTPGHLEQIQALVVRLRIENDVMAVIQDITDPSVNTVVLNTLYTTIGEMAASAGGFTTQLDEKLVTLLFLLPNDSQAGMVYHALTLLEQLLSALSTKNIPGYPGIRWNVAAGVSSGTLMITSPYHETANRRVLIYDGPAFEQADEALQLATTGRIVVHRDVLRRLGSPPDGQWIDVHYFLPSESFTKSPVAQAVKDFRPKKRQTTPDLPRRQLLTWVDHALSAQPDRFLRGILTERLIVMEVCLQALSLNAPEDAEQWQQIMGRVLGIIERYGAVLVQQQNEYLQLAFIDDAPLGRIAPRAVSLALSLKRTLQAIEIETRMSIAAGRGYMGMVGAHHVRHSIILGQAAQQAHQLLALAPEGEIVVNEPIRQATQQEFGWRPLEDGFILTGEITLGSGLVTRVQSKPTMPILEREEASKALDEVIESARKGETHLLLITGEGGYGRSSLIDLLIDKWLRADGNGFLSIGPAYVPAVPYSLWIPIWQGIFGLSPENDAKQNLETLKSAIDRLLPDAQSVTSLFADVMGLVPETPPHVDGLSAPVRQQRLLEANATLLRYLAELTPVLLVFERVDNADTLSLNLIERLAEQFEDVPVLFCIEDRQQSVYSLSQRFTSAKTVAADPLSAKGAWQLLRHILPNVDWPYSYRLALEERLGDPKSEKVVEVSPTFALMLGYVLRDVIVGEDQRTFKDDVLPQNWPRNIEEVTQLILQKVLSATERRIIERASASGTFFYHQFDWLDTTDLTVDLEQIRSLQITKPFIDLGHTRRWDHFTHETVRLTIYRNLDAKTRHTIHEKIAQWYLRRQPGHGSHALVAYHYQQGGYIAEAVDAYVKASAHATAWGAESEASQLLLAAERLVTSQDDHTPTRCKVHLGWAKLWRQQGHYTRALNSVERAYEHAEALNDTELIGESLVLRAWLNYLVGKWEIALDDARTAAQLPVENLAIRSQALWVQARVLYDIQQQHQAAKLLMRALEMNAIQSEALLIAMELDAASILLADYQRDAARISVLRAYQRALVLNDSILLHRVTKLLGHIQLLYGEADSAVNSLEQAISLPPPPNASFTELGDLLRDYAVALCYQGRYVDAEAAFDTAQSYYIGEPNEEKHEQILNLLRVSEFYLDRLLLDDAQNILSMLNTQRQTLALPYQYLLDLTQIQVYLQQNELEKARDLLKTFNELPDSATKQWYLPLIHTREAELLLAEEQWELARARAIQALGSVSPNGDLRALTLIYILIAEANIILQNRHEIIVDALERAVRTGRKQGRRLHLARALYVWGKYLRHTSLRGSTLARSNSYIFEAQMLFQEMNIDPEEYMPDYLKQIWEQTSVEEAHL